MTQIAFTGDLAFSKHFLNKYSDENLFSEKVEKFLSDSDYTVVNVEGAVSSSPISAEKALVHANPVECVESIKRINGNIWNIANNHSVDCGAEGLKSTLEVASENNIQTVGAGMDLNEAMKPVIIDKDGGIGILSVTFNAGNRADSNTPGCFMSEDEENIKKQIEEIKANNRWCVVVSHAGQEFTQMPMPYLRKLYKRYLKYGADIVVGHHPHVVENYETFGDKIVFYSLGNFVFDTDYQRAQKYTDYGVLIKIKFSENSYSWDYLSTKINRENNTVSEGDKPEIFRNIGAFEYGLLWPLAAKDLCLNERVKYAFLRSYAREYKYLDWLFKKEFKDCKKKYGKDVMRGRFLYMFRLWKFADSKVVDYIKKRV